MSLVATTPPNVRANGSALGICHAVIFGIIGSLLPAHFAQLADIGANYGYEIYEEIKQPFKQSLGNVTNVPARVGPDIRERLEGVKAKFHSIADWLDKTRGASLECKKIYSFGFLRQTNYQ